jgi:TonB family protein
MAIELALTHWGGRAMLRYFHRLILVLACFAAPALAGDVPTREQSVAVQVQIDANGKVKSAQVVPDPTVPAALNRVATELALKLGFVPAKKAGQAVPSESVLFLVLAIEPRSDGTFGIRLKQASNGPMVVHMGKIYLPKYQARGDRGATLVVGVSLGADGVPAMESFKAESVMMRSPSKFAEARYLDAIATSLRNTRFRVDKVDGVAIPTYVRLPYQFDGGGEKLDGKTGQPAKQSSPPGMEERSEQQGVELPRVVFNVPSG